AKSKDNTIDAWGDVTGNLQTMCAEIGMGIFDAFNQSEIIQDLIAFTQDLIDMVRGEGCGAFSDLKEVAKFALDIIDGALSAVITTFKLIVLALDSAYEAFSSFGRDVYEALQPVIDGLLYIYDLVKTILTSVGKGLSSEVNKSWAQTFGRKTEIEPEDRASQNENHFRTVKRTVKAPAAAKSGGGSGRSGGGSARKELTEEEKAVETLIKKYSDADKQKWAMAKSTVELAKVNMAMLTDEARTQEEKRIKLLELDNAHNQLLEGLNKELALAAKIGDDKTRDYTLKTIQDQIDAENELYNAKVKAAEYSANMKIIDEENKTLLDRVFGTKEEAEKKIEEIKKTLQTQLQGLSMIEADTSMTDEEALSAMAKILKKTPEQLAEEFGQKEQTIQQFIENYKKALAEAAAAQVNSVNAADQWHKKLEQYAISVGKNMGNAMTEWIMGEKTASQALADFAKDLIKNAVNLMAQWVGVYTMLLAFGLGNPRAAAQGATKAVLGVDLKKAATGGYISGPGTGTSDSIPAMLSNGEYVIRSAAVDMIGRPALDALNAG
ncbi:MAG: hypothetical protein IJV46_03305, partial [Acidaminococcaceae bacterium]|nr:hypothetical protein [Acidaminococcaceae bacterium]